jgi:anthranilate phosphoribosyltransferase
MLHHATPFPRPADVDVILDTCGTGGDRLHTFNVSTSAALVCAAAGVRVAKHGNRSASSKCGSAEVLEAMGYPITEPAESAAARLLRDRFCFLFAPLYHPAMKHAAEARKSLRVRTLFNICGPLSNPARPTHQIVGVASPALMEPVVRALASLGCRGALVVHGDDGMDEISTTRPSRALRLEAGGHWHVMEINPAALGFRQAVLSDLIGGDAQVNAAIVREVLEGEAGPRADIVNLNCWIEWWPDNR